MTSQPPSDYFRISDSKAVLSLSDDTVRRAVKRGELTLCKIGRAALISRAEAKAWIEAGNGMGEAKGE